MGRRLTPEQRAAMLAASRERRSSQIADYFWIGGPLLADGVAAARVGVSARTIQRWRAEGLLIRQPEPVGS